MNGIRKRKLVILFFTLLLLFLGLDARLALLSSGTAEGAAQAGADHGRYAVTVNTGRGTIYDRSLRPLVNTEAEYVAVVAPESDAAAELAALAPHVSDLSALEQGFERGLPFTIRVDSPDIRADGVTVVRTLRRYAQTAVAPHVVGYVDGDGKGVSGIEKAFDAALSAQSGSETVSIAVDALRRPLAGVEPEVTQKGDSAAGVVLTLDKNIQLAAQEAAAKYLKSGCAVVMDVKSGDLLAVASEPAYSPDDVAAALKAEDSPLVNRAFSAYNLGSIFKIAVASTALENGVSSARTYTCTGEVDVSGRAFHCEKRSGHGTEDMALAFANSCNTYFITLGQLIGGKAILATAGRFGFGTGTVFAPGLASDAGQLPQASVLSSPAAVANLSIGQGTLMVTPVQVACMVSAVANGGLLPTARLVDGTTSGDGKVKDEYPNAVPERVLPASVAAQVRGFMIETVDEGTGQPAKPVYGGAGGKTSTAETGWVQNGKIINQAWFAGFYPAASPRYAIVAVCENGTAGGADAGPVFRSIANSLAPLCGYPSVPQ